MKNTRYEHEPVLLKEVLQGLRIRPDGFYVDCTFGRGGHSRAILQCLSSRGRLVAIDKDPDAGAMLDEQLEKDPRFELIQGSYTKLGEIIKDRGMMGQTDGLLLDLGVSSPQLDDPSRGFSFARDGQLDMRMDNRTGMTASVWLQRATGREIEEVLRRYGEERYSRKIARAIVHERQQTELLRTGQLAELIAAAVPSREKDKHPATRSFQAIRIFINRELEELKNVLEQAVEVLGAGGRLAVISFHSLEDRMVKRFMRDMNRGDNYPPEVPVPGHWLAPRLKLIGKATYPAAAEIKQNPRARSAVLRIAEKITP